MIFCPTFSPAQSEQMKTIFAKFELISLFHEVPLFSLRDDQTQRLRIITNLIISNPDHSLLETYFQEHLPILIFFLIILFVTKRDIF